LLSSTIAQGGDHGHNREYQARTNISSSAPFVELDQSFASRIAAISPFVDQLMRFIRVFGGRFSANDSEDEIEIAIHEALANAVIHGNRENPDKKVYVNCHCNMRGEIFITVRDEGQGFDHRAVLDPTEPERLLLSHGRGLHLMRALMDEIKFEDNGTVVRKRKRTNTSIP
jgi:serine/threonine-protein kinase RsbW